MAWGVEGDAHRVEAAPDKPGRNVRRNKENLDLPARRRNGNPLRRGGQAASGKYARSNRAKTFCPPFRGWVWQVQGGVAGQAGWALVDRQGPDA